jgi:cytochrome c biogenesis protein CcmG, thiol:disulfide interchange protein DsbE
MKKLLIPMLLLFVEISLGQTNYYSFNSDSIYNEMRIEQIFEQIIKTNPDSFYVTPTIYHRVLKNDSTINYLSFVARKKVTTANKSRFIFEFKQDSLFLFLNKKLPEFNLKDLNGKEFSSSKLIGKPTLINYWAIYCGPCVAEFPQLDELKVKYGEKMNFIAIAENTCTEGELNKFLIKHPFSFYILQNGEEYKKTLKIGAIPKNIFIDKEGIIRYIEENYPSEIDQKTGKKIFTENNVFVRNIEKLTN